MGLQTVLWCDRRALERLCLLHETATVTLDDVAEDFELVLGESYPLHLFFAERHTVASTFTVDTTLARTYRCE